MGETGGVRSRTWLPRASRTLPLRDGTERWARSAFFAALALLSVGVLSFSVAARQQRIHEQVERTREVIGALRSVLAAVVDVETGQRGYVLAGDEAFLAPQQAAKASLPARLERLGELTAADPEQQTRLAHLAVLVTEKVSLADALVALRRERGLDAARAAVASGEGKRAQDAIRAAVAAMEETEQATLHRQTDAAWRASIAVRSSVVVGSALAFLVGAWGLLVVTRGFAQIRRAEAALREANEGLESRVRERTEELASNTENVHRLIAQAPVAIALLDRDLRYLAASRLWVEQYGRGRVDVVGLLHYDIHPDLPEEWRAVHRRGLSGEIVKNDEDTWVKSDGTTAVLRWAVHPWTDGRGAVGGIIMSAEDITERKRTEAAARESAAEVRRLNVELEQRVAERTAELAAKNRELEAFTYSVSHDLKAPLRGIEGYSRLLIEDHAGALDGEGRVFLQNVREATVHMGRLIDDLLAYSRIERRAQQIATLLPLDLVRQLVAERAPDVAAAGAEVTIDLPPTAVCADREGLTLALRNLLDNALKFSRAAPRPAIAISAVEGADTFTLQVRDNGAGFDMRFRERIFDIFQRLHRPEDFPGTGIGLAIVRKAMERMGGRAWAQGEPGRGAAFFLELPR